MFSPHSTTTTMTIKNHIPAPLLLLFLLLCYTFTPSHAIRLSVEERITILNAHNSKRGMVNPPAANMVALKYSKDLEETAHKWAQQCTGSTLLNHNPDRSDGHSTSVGENIYGTTASSVSLSNAITMWDNEKSDYSLSSNSCASGKVCGHYTQIAWAESTHVGCAKYYCPNLRFSSGLVCNYGPAGNWYGKKPYQAASSCVSGKYFNGKSNQCENCNCDTETSLGTQCNSDGMCICKHGYTGSSCSITLNDADSDVETESVDDEKSRAAGVMMHRNGIFVALIIGLLLCLFW